MPDEFDLTSVTNNAFFRRLWLVRKAMESAPIDRAIELARKAEEFIAGSGVQPSLEQAKLIEASKPPQTPMEVATTGPSARMAPRIEARPADARAGLVLSAEQRERLLERLAEGARNADLATQFGISPRQVQGVRMGSAREIAERRNRVPKTARAPSDLSQEQVTANAEPRNRVPNTSYPVSDLSQERATAEDIVRYLRQQDDIVVPQGEGAFLVNGRFRLELPELVARANKMRARQGKPEFRLGRELSNQNRVRQATRHPIFWEQESGSDQALARAN